MALICVMVYALVRSEGDGSGGMAVDDRRMKRALD